VSTEPPPDEPTADGPGRVPGPGTHPSRLPRPVTGGSDPAGTAAPDPRSPAQLIPRSLLDFLA